MLVLAAQKQNCIFFRSLCQSKLDPLIKHHFLTKRSLPGTMRKIDTSCAKVDIEREAFHGRQLLRKKRHVCAFFRDSLLMMTKKKQKGSPLFDLPETTEQGFVSLSM